MKISIEAYLNGGNRILLSAIVQTTKLVIDHTGVITVDYANGTWDIINPCFNPGLMYFEVKTIEQEIRCINCGHHENDHEKEEDNEYCLMHNCSCRVWRPIC